LNSISPYLGQQQTEAWWAKLARRRRIVVVHRRHYFLALVLVPPNPAPNPAIDTKHIRKPFGEFRIEGEPALHQRFR